MQEFKKAIEKAVSDLYGEQIEVQLSRPDEKFGDYATNVALQLAAKTGKNPREIAQSIKEHLAESDFLVGVEGPGFINVKLNDGQLIQMVNAASYLPKPLDGQEILVEFGDPNPFKEMHIGHLYSYIVGDSISRLLESAGATVRRLSYHGDVGRQVAQAIWGMKQIDVVDDVSLGKAYAKGAQAYEVDEAAKAEIDQINQQVYKHDDPTINELHRKGVQISFDSFDKILKRINIKTDKRYLESQSTPVGQEIVEANIGKVFKQSEGAIIFEGEKVGLHTRVFITSQGLPTYETKDLGLVKLKHQDYPNFSESIVITANEQAEYFKVMLAALAQIKPDLAHKTKHLSHGFVSLTSGKMSSRSGKVYSAADLIGDVEQKAAKLFPQSDDNMHIAAIKYGLLKHRLGSDIVFDAEESVSIEGNSGPYLQYAHARAASIISKAGAEGGLSDLKDDERSLARKITEYPEVVDKSVRELMPHHVCTYLYELAQTFNSFYEHNRVVGDERQAARLALVSAYAGVLKSGLNLLGIAAPEHV